MKRFLDWKILLGIILISLTAGVYFIHFLIFRDPQHIFLYFIGDVAFVFFELLLVTLVIHRLLHYRERKAMVSKLNMLAGTFFSEMGTELLRELSCFDKESCDKMRTLALPRDWSEKEFLDLHQSIYSHTYEIQVKNHNLKFLKTFLQEKKLFLLDLIQNPCLLENESFSNLIWAVYHLTQELIHRQDVSVLPDTDYQHLEEDITRVYHLLIIEWMRYMKHLKHNYPFLFSLADRRNPFKKVPPVEVK